MQYWVSWVRKNVRPQSGAAAILVSKCLARVLSNPLDFKSCPEASQLLTSAFARLGARTFAENARRVARGRGIELGGKDAHKWGGSQASLQMSAAVSQRCSLCLIRGAPPLNLTALPPGLSPTLKSVP